MATYNLSSNGNAEFAHVPDINLLEGARRTDCHVNMTNGITLPGHCNTSLSGAAGTRNGLELVYHGEIWTPEVIQRIVTLAVIMTLTLFGNVIIIIVLTCSKYRKLNSRVNIFIINLAIGDLTVCCFTMTTEVSESRVVRPSNIDTLVPIE